MRAPALQIAPGPWWHAWRDRLERWLEEERDQLVLWLPVCFGAGIAAWFMLPDRARWLGLILAAGAIVAAGLAAGRGGRAARVATLAAFAIACGCATIWWRAEQVAAPVLARPVVARFVGRVDTVEPLPARGIVRLGLAIEDAADAGLPPGIRVNVNERDLPAGVAAGAVLAMRARLMPPSPPPVPEAFDFARVAWFERLGSTGRAIGKVKVLRPAETGGDTLRARISAHIHARVEGSAGGIASALATGDRGAIDEADEEAMRRSGLAHLLSVSGLHVTAVVGATMLVVLRLLALSPVLALRWRLPLVAAGAAAIVAVFYTWLTGAQVPTMRSCIAALLVLAALALGREAITLRLVAAGALIVLLLWPQALVSASFQLSFAAVTAIVALHEHPRVRGWFLQREERWPARLARGLGSLLLTGIVVELALMPIGLFHFHKAGVYGALANMVAIPLTTFVVMPFEALALVLDLAGLGTPVWWVVARALDLLLAIAHWTANAPGSVKALPNMPHGAYALIVAGGLWLALWRTRARLAGLPAIAAGVLWAVATPAPDLLVTGDGRHVALRTEAGGFVLLRERAGDYVRSILGESGGTLEELGAIDDDGRARCSGDLCVVRVAGAGRQWTIAATRSTYLLPIEEMTAVCRTSDIVVSDRWLPRTCRPAWLKLDRPTLARTGGVAIGFDPLRLRHVARPAAGHPWRDPPTVAPPRRQ